MVQEARAAQQAMPQQTPKKAKKRYMPFVQLGLVLGFIAVVYISFVGNVLTNATPVPMKIGPYDRYQFETQQNAIPQLKQQYNTEIPIDAAFVAHYEGSGTNIKVWLGEASEENLSKLFADLIRRIETGENKAYTDFNKLDVGGMTVYSIKRDNEPQYFYKVGRKFIWIAITGNTGNASRILIDTMKTLTGSHDGM